jgi:CIC family chloride channel protein
VTSPRPAFAFGLATLLVGLVAGLFAIVFRLALSTAMRRLYGSADILADVESWSWEWRILVPTLGGLVAGSLSSAVARQEGGHAVADILETVAIGRGDIALPRVLMKSLASLCAQIGGASIGREGPIIQFGAAMGSLIGRRGGLRSADTRVLVAAGTAAGFAAAYNTPIAAVLFVLEIVTGLMTLEVVLPVAVAVTVATLLTRAVLGPGPLYGQRTFALSSWTEFPMYAALGLACGVVGALFVTGLSRAEREVLRLPLRRPTRAALGGTVLGLVAIAVPAVAGNGYEAIQSALDGRTVGLVLLGWLVAKAFGTTTSVASGNPGGVFTPSMFLGAALGGLLGGLVYPGNTGPYALVGMAAMAAATMHAPLMATALVFELSGDYEIVLPLLIATGIAATVSRRIHPDSVYTEELHRRGIDWHGSLLQRLAGTIRARDLLRPSPPTVVPGASLADVLALFEAGAPAVYVEGEVPGAILLRDAWRARESGATGVTAADLARPVPTVRPDDTLPELADRLRAPEWAELPVVERGAIIGTLTQRDLLRAFDQDLLDRASLLTRAVGDPYEDLDEIQLPDGLSAAWVDVPEASVGKVIADGDWFDVHKVHVIAVRSTQTALGARRAAPPGSSALMATDQILVLGPSEGVDSLRERPAGSGPS